MALYTLKELKLFSIGKAATAEFEEVGRYRSPRPRMVSSASKTTRKGCWEVIEEQERGRGREEHCQIYIFVFLYCHCKGSQIREKQV